MEHRYNTPNLWLVFAEECPVISAIPIIGAICFKHFCIAYFANKLPSN